MRFIKTFCMIASAMALCSCVTVVQPEVQGLGPLYLPDKPAPAGMYGVITDEAENRITVQDANNSENSVVLNLSEDVCVVDAQTGMSASLKDRESDRVAVFYGPAATKSVPPQSNAIAIAVNLPEELTSMPHYGVVESVTKEGDSIIALTLTNSGWLNVTINAETKLMPYLTRNIVTMDHIREGSELMLWYGIVLESFPGQTTAGMAVLLRNPQ